MKKIIFITTLLISYLFANNTYANNYINAYKDVDGTIVKGVAIKNQKDFGKIDINKKSVTNKFSNPDQRFKNNFTKTNKNSNRNIRAIKW